MEPEITINKYINGELSGSALETFETLLNKDQKLQEKVKFHLKVEKIFRINEEVENNESLKAMMNELSKTHILPKPDEAPDMYQKEAEIIAHPEILPENNGKVRRTVSFALLAAAAAFLLFMFLPTLQQKTNPEIAENQFQLVELDISMGNQNIDKLYNDARKNYTTGNFKVANDGFTAYLQAKPKVPNVWLAKGCTEFKLDDNNEALLSFQKAIEMDEGNLYKAQAHWYLALCHLKKDEPQKAMNQLKSIAEGQDYYKEAQRLLKKLK